MKIYTKTGDNGTTGLLGGDRLSKSDIQIEAYGTIDELNSHFGLVADFEVNKFNRDFHTKIQSVLFDIGSHLAKSEEFDSKDLPNIDEKVISQLEDRMDSMTSELSELKTFILPSGHVEISHTHIARTVCRRAERRVVALAEEIDVLEIIQKFLNRLSDYLFILSRWMSKQLKVVEIPWGS
ncbi:cob(I)yrinic acid a,c-diamide adenosyltransferase [Reichenbachiella versicolor]|uniref:cob(I)yrinic acid a,c-diamide adenosyltransferase n=1 Tax=Reichenbachiella versicolor TaxID=1821036 RepID=UPI000D6DEDD7|nr:cob(I)yrinic acid a,c-diamide adenosyltransferase [Reichenbachiella versicolor]